jgi:hypothetical protein
MPQNADWTPSGKPLIPYVRHKYVINEIKDSLNMRNKYDFFMLSATI